MRLLLIARDPGRAEAVAKDCRKKGAAVELALLDVRDTSHLVQSIVAFDDAHPVDLVIANAGVETSLGPNRSAESVEASLEQIRVNLEGVVTTVTPLLDRMKRRGDGSIVLVSSLAALDPLADQPVYSATKAAVAAWGQALRSWLRSSGIRVAVVYPGFVATGMKERYRGARPFEMTADAAARLIARAAIRGRATLAFPWQLVWLIRLGRLVPRPIRDRIVDRWLTFEIGP